jgi:hypothetical protein
MDTELVNELIDRDWAPFLTQARRLGLGETQRSGERIDVVVTPLGSEERFCAVLLCDGYDALAPVLDFADPATGERGREQWPRMGNAPYNSIVYGGEHLPILCVPGTRGYHLHPSHCAESHDKKIWTLPRQASLLARLMRQMGPYQGRGV